MKNAVPYVITFLHEKKYAIPHNGLIFNEIKLQKSTFFILASPQRTRMTKTQVANPPKVQNSRHFFVVRRKRYL